MTGAFPLKYLFLSVLLLFGLLDGAEVNATIVDGNVTVYKSLLGTLQKESNLTEEETLEKIMLQDLLKQSSQGVAFVPKPVKPAKDENGYRNLFLYFLDDISQIGTIQKELGQSNVKIATIESTIASKPSSDVHLRSYQLQDAFYHKKVSLEKKYISLLHSELEQLQNAMLSSLKTLEFDSKKLSASLSRVQQDVLKYETILNRLDIREEQAQLVGDRKETARLEKEIKAHKLAYHNEIKVLLSTRFLLFSAYIKAKDNRAFIEEKRLRNESVSYHLLSQNQMEAYLAPLLLTFENSYMGKIGTLAGSGEQEFEALLYDGWKFVNQPIFTLNGTDISIFKIAVALLVFIFGFLFGLLYKSKIKNLTSNRRSFSPSTRTLLANLGFYTIVTISFFVALNIVGVKLSSLALVAGALSVGIGFGLQNIVSNFVSGLILMFERSIKIGDYVEIGEHRGYVTDIRMRSTTINTNENIDIIIPNQSFIEGNVINWTMSDSVRRFSIPFGVAYGTDAHRVIDIVIDAVHRSEVADAIVEDPLRTTRVIMTEMADSSVNFELLVWVKGDKLHKPKRTASEFLIIIYDALYENNIEIPFPQRDLHIRSVDKGVSFVTLQEKE